jgi:hypothetical protein
MTEQRPKTEEAGLLRAGPFMDTTAPEVGARIQGGVTGSNSRSRPA